MTFRKATNIVAVVVFALVLCCVVGTKALDKAGVDFPEWAGVGTVHSYLEGRDYTKMPSISLESYLEKGCQEQFNEYVADSIPMRDKVILANAVQQRLSIEAANLCFGYACYPTFFESNYLYIPKSRALAQMPLRKTESRMAALKQFGEGIASMAKRYPEKEFLLFIVDRSNTSPANPATKLLSFPLTTNEVKDALENCFNEVNNVTVASVWYHNQENYYEDFFTTDHHWNILGAAKAYSCIAEFLSLEPFDPLPLFEVQGPRFIGANARNGLYPMDENPFDSEFDFDEVTILDNEGNITRKGDDHTLYYESPKESQRRAFYDLWYGKRGSSPMILGRGKGAAILICDSFGSALKRALAMNYETLYVDYDLHGDSKSENLTLSSRIERPGVQDVVFVACASNYAGMKNHMPAYFE